MDTARIANRWLEANDWTSALNREAQDIAGRVDGRILRATPNRVEISAPRFGRNARIEIMVNQTASAWHPDRTGIDVSAFHVGFDDTRAWRMFERAFRDAWVWGGRDSNFVTWNPHDVPEAIRQVSAAVQDALNDLRPPAR